MINSSALDRVIAPEQRRQSYIELLCSNTIDEYETKQNPQVPLHREIHARYSNLGDFSTLIERLNLSAIIDGHVYKKLVSPGGTEVITQESAVIYDCACWCEGQKEPYDSTWLRRKAFLTDLNAGEVITGLQQLLLTMRKGEFCEGLISPEYGFGKGGVPPRIPKNATIFCVISVIRVYRDGFHVRQLLNFHQSSDDNNFKTCFKICDQARTAGNYYLSKDRCRLALARYKSAIDLLEGLTFKDEDQEKTANGLLRKLYTNCANACVKLKKPRQALSFCKLALDLDEKCLKTLWLYARAWEIRNDFDRALIYVRRALRIAGKDGREDEIKPFVSYEQRLREQMQRATEQHKELNRAMAQAVTRSITLMVIFTVLDIQQSNALSLKVVAPELVRIGEPMWLNCSYKLTADERFWQVKWFKDNKEFYKYDHASDKPRVIPVPGIQIWENKSHAGTVYLHKTDLSSEGEYRCEVGADPTFEVIKKTVNVKIYVLPIKGPKIDILDARDTSKLTTSDSHDMVYAIGDTIDLKCQTAPSKPAASLRWFINDREIPIPTSNASSSIDPISSSDGDLSTSGANSDGVKVSPISYNFHFKGILSSWSTLKFKLQKHQLVHGRVSFKCVATIRQEYSLDSKQLIVIMSSDGTSIASHSDDPHSAALSHRSYHHNNNNNYHHHNHHHSSQSTNLRRKDIDYSERLRRSMTSDPLENYAKLHHGPNAVNSDRIKHNNNIDNINMNDAYRFTTHEDAKRTSLVSREHALSAGQDVYDRGAAPRSTRTKRTSRLNDVENIMRQQQYHSDDITNNNNNEFVYYYENSDTTLGAKITGSDSGWRTGVDPFVNYVKATTDIEPDTGGGIAADETNMDRSTHGNNRLSTRNQSIKIMYTKERDTRRPTLNWPPMMAGRILIDSVSGSVGVASLSKLSSLSDTDLTHNDGLAVDSTTAYSSSSTDRIYDSRASHTVNNIYAPTATQKTADNYIADTKLFLEYMINQINCSCANGAIDTQLAWYINDESLDWLDTRHYASKVSSDHRQTLITIGFQQVPIPMSPGTQQIANSVSGTQPIDNKKSSKPVTLSTVLAQYVHKPQLKSPHHRQQTQQQQLHSTVPSNQRQQQQALQHQTIRIKCRATHSQHLHSSSETITFDFNPPGQRTPGMALGRGQAHQIIQASSGLGSGAAASLRLTNNYSTQCSIVASLIATLLLVLGAQLSCLLPACSSRQIVG
ncbi:Inactive peptidyl-prolyl cis-trans isomerase FKBP6 [Fragariocoptes setiger]|uniref:peptidylprolyl isomerase n=1 Tax=Fragariocoptes setiger TaxID=1670756 RepID=A0ABQ7SB65_9ACAR|nr:Inactive peptidyl-prolyl cis-trans isomerase FKBP6 [Fragariocoptes setiger]